MDPLSLKRDKRLMYKEELFMRKVINLNKDWLFKERYSKEDINSTTNESFERVDLPHTQKLIPYNDFNWEEYQFVSSYKKIFELEKNKNKSYILSFLGIAQKSSIYINKKLVKENKCGYNTIDIDATDFLKNGINEIYVMVSSKEENFPPFGNIVDYLGYGGIYRECYLYETGKNYIINPFFYTKDLLNDNRKYHLELEVNNKFDGKINYFVIDNQKAIIQDSFLLEERNVIEGNLESVKLWSPENPYLYDIIIQLEDKKGIIIDEISFKYGFRDIRVDKNGLYLNGKKYLIRGLNRHQSFPYVGYAMPKSMQKEDARILKEELGANSVRCSHYMNHPVFLDECDRLGIIVYEEFPGWQYIGDEDWKKKAMINLDNMILRDRNHPSIFFFGIRINESPDDYRFNMDSYKRAKELDPTRIITGTRAHTRGLDFDDCYSYNNFFVELTPKLLFSKREVTKGKNPYLITEYCGHMHPNKPYDTEKRRLDTSLIHKNIISRVEKTKGIIGAMGWAFADYNTHKNFGPNDMICYHGVLDMFRNPKLSSFVYSVYREKPFLEISTALAPGDFDGSYYLAPYIYTKMDKVEMYNESGLIHTYYSKDGIDNKVFPICDFYGDTLIEKLGKKKAKKYNKVIQFVLKYGMNFVKLALRFGPFFLLKNIKELTFYFTDFDKHIYTLKGYKDDKVVLEKKIGCGSFSCLDVSLSKEYLDVSETYDVVKVCAKVLDTNGNNIKYLNEIVNISVSEGLEVIGPKSVSTLGGYATFYIKNKYYEKSKEKIIISMDRSSIKISKSIEIRN